MLKRFSPQEMDSEFNLAFAFAPGASPVTRPSLSAKPCVRMFGLDLVDSPRRQLARELVELSASGGLATVMVINARCIHAARQPVYRRALGRADVLLPEGSGMEFAARLAGVNLRESPDAADLCSDICSHAAAHGQSIFLIGGKPGVAAAAAEAMVKRFPQLRVAGTRAGAGEMQDDLSVLDEIDASGADIVLAGMDHPTQAIWIDRVRSSLSARIVMGVGGFFDTWQAASRVPVPHVPGNLRFLGTALAHAWAARYLSGRCSLVVKHAFDRAVAILALLAFAPLFLVIMLAIKREDGGPVFFRQTRIGDLGKPFRMWKFRSMVVDAEARLAAIRARSERDGTCFKMKNDPRVTRVGAVLRRLSLDELPQLLNVACGQMSLVGPRPALPREVLSYSPAALERLEGRPGLTCTWQVSGRANIPFEQQVELDVAYLRTRSFMFDVLLMFRTVPAVLTARGAY